MVDKNVNEVTDLDTFFGPLGSRLHLSALTLAGCWQSALGFQPASAEDTLRNHGVSKNKRKKLFSAIRSAFNCPLDSGLFRLDMQFGKTVHLLSPLVAEEKTSGSEPIIWLAPGLFGVGLGELMLARSYEGPGRIRLLRYPMLRAMSDAGSAIEAHVSGVLEQLSATEATDPLVLAGFSLGAHVMFEVACRLLLAGRPVASLVLIHSVAFPQRSDLSAFDYQLTECRKPHEFRRWIKWMLGSERPGGMKFSSRLLAKLSSIGCCELAFRMDAAISCVIRLKAFSYSVRHAYYPGKVTLLRPSGEGSHSEKDAGWSTFCNEMQISLVPAAPSKFLSDENRAVVAKELANLANVGNSIDSASV